jgi:serine/threonine-protein kinase
MSTLQPGDIVAGKYEIRRVLGDGGMGVVYEAEHLRLGTLVAIKTIRAEVLGGRDVVERFEREARAAARLKSPHIARVMDVDSFEDGAPFLVMELLVGFDLDTILERRLRLPVGEAVDLVLQAASGMTEAHSVGIVHRDIKPSNLFLCDDGIGQELKILDFGISKTASDVNVTSTRASLGTPLYMSPEQIRSARAVDARTDVWSLGAVLYELVCGRPPFMAETPAAVIAAITADPVPRLADQGVALPDGFEAVVSRALAKELDERYASMEQLGEALLPYADNPLHFRPRTSLIPGSGGSLLPSAKVVSRAAATPTAMAATESASAIQTNPLSEDGRAVPRSSADGASLDGLPAGGTDAGWEADTDERHRVVGGPRGRRIGLAVSVLGLLALGLGWMAMRVDAASTAEPAASADIEPAPPSPADAPQPSTADSMQAVRELGVPPHEAAQKALPETTEAERPAPAPSARPSIKPLAVPRPPGASPRPSLKPASPTPKQQSPTSSPKPTLDHSPHEVAPGENPVRL